MKRFFPLVAIILLFTACKKEKQNPPVLDVVGNWTLYSWQLGSTNATVAQFPCIAENVTKVNADNTTSSGYMGKDTCFIVRPTGPFSGWSAIGLPTDPPFTSTWSRNGNNIYMYGAHYVISSANNHLYLTLTDTITQGFTSPQISKVVEIKE